MRKIILLTALLTVLLAAGVLADDVGQVVDPSHPNEFAHQTLNPNCLECASCHSCENPTAAHPCLINCPRHSLQFVGEHKAGEGPEIVVIDQLAGLYGSVTFAHRLHAEMSNMTGGCTNCHHYSENTGKIPACGECHDAETNQVNLRQPSLKGAYHRQCINCHLDWSGENACGFCHVQIAEGESYVQPDSTDIVGIPHPHISATATYTYNTSYENGPVVTFHHQDHVDHFSQSCVDCHRGDTCRSCHDTHQTEPRKVSHVTECWSCHGERDCDFCHAREPMERFDHKRSTGFDLEPYHTENTCRVCHGDPKAFRTPTGNCADCHIHWDSDHFNHAVTGLALSEDHLDLSCEDCHLEMEMQAAPSCVDCHDEQLYPDELPGERVR